MIGDAQAGVGHAAVRQMRRDVGSQSVADQSRGSPTPSFAIGRSVAAIANAPIASAPGRAGILAPAERRRPATAPIPSPVKIPVNAKTRQPVGALATLAWYRMTGSFRQRGDDRLSGVARRPGAQRHVEIRDGVERGGASRAR